MQIGVLDNDDGRADLVSASLRSVGHACRQFKSGESLLETLQRDGFDLLVLNAQSAGLRVLQALRSKLVSGLPVLFVADRADEETIVAAIEAGADDYVVNPIRRGDLVARVGVLLRRTYPQHYADERVRFGPYTFETASSRISVNGKAIDITSKEFALALLFFRNLGRPLSRAYILETIWSGEPDVASRTMDTHVSRVRNKLGLRPENGYRLAPVYSYGYRLEQLAEENGP